MRVNTVTQKEQIESVMRGLMQALEKLAPHPDRPMHSGPIFVQIDAHLKPAAEYDGMLGSMMLEGLLSTAFSEVSSSQSSPNIDVSNTADAASEYLVDRASKPYTVGRKNSITRIFNKKITHDRMMSAYLKDLPRRLGIERWLADYQRKLYALQKHAPAADFSLAA